MNYRDQQLNACQQYRHKTHTALTTLQSSLASLAAAQSTTAPHSRTCVIKQQAFTATVLLSQTPSHMVLQIREETCVHYSGQSMENFTRAQGVCVRVMGRGGKFPSLVRRGEMMSSIRCWPLDTPPPQPISVRHSHVPTNLGEDCLC